MDDLTILLRLDRSLAERESAAWHSGEKARIDRTLSDAEVAERAKSEFIRRENAQRVQESARARKTEIERAREAAKEEAKLRAEAAKLLTQIEREAAKEKGRIDRELEREIQEASRRRTAEERAGAAERKRLDNRALTDVEIAERAKADIYRRANRQRIEEVVKAHRTEMDRMRESERAASQVMTATKAAVSSFAGQMIGLSSASAVLGEVQAGFQSIHDAVFNSTELMQEFRESLLELAALKDRMGDTSTEAVETLQLMAQTGQTRQDAADLQTGFLGMAESMVGPGKKISEADSLKAMVGLGRLQAAQGASAETFGELGGLILQASKGPMAPEDVTREAAALYDIQQPGNFGKGGFGSAIGMYGKAMPFVAADIVTSREAMALTSAFSIPRGEEAATAVRQFMQATVGAQGRDRKVKGMEGAEENIGAATYLAGLGAKMGDSPMSIAKLVSGDLTRAEEAAKAKGAGFNPIDYLQSRGYGNQESALALLNFHGMLQTGSWAEFEKLANDPNLGAGRRAEAEAKLASDPGLLGRQARSVEEVGKMVPGMGREEIMRSLRSFGRARLEARDAGRNTLGLSDQADLERTGFFDVFNFRKIAEMALVKGETSAMIREYADRENIPYSLSRGMGGSTYLSEDEQFRVSRELAARGVNFGQEVGADLAEAARRLNEVVTKIDRLATPPTPPPLQGSPRQGPTSAQ